MKKLHLLSVLLLTLGGGLITLFTQAIAAEVGSGAEIINNNCARCHNSRPAQEFSTQEWSVILPHMREKAHLTGQETETVMDFFKTLSGGPVKNVADVATMPVMDGGALMKKFGCQGCHSFNGKGGALGPALDNVVAQRGGEFVMKKLTDPQFNNPSSAMPKMPLTSAQINVLVGFLGKK